jgi:hypothetical protein
VLIRPASKAVPVVPHTDATFQVNFGKSAARY